MVTEIALVETNQYERYKDKVFEAYCSVIKFLGYPSIHNIFGEYCSMVDKEIMHLQINEYPDEFYDGSPGKSKKIILPDYIIGDLPRYIGMEPDITFEIIEKILIDHQIFYISDDYYNSPLKEVW